MAQDRSSRDLEGSTARRSCPAPPRSAPTATAPGPPPPSDRDDRTALAALAAPRPPDGPATSSPTHVWGKAHDGHDHEAVSDRCPHCDVHPRAPPDRRAPRPALAMAWPDAPRRTSLGAQPPSAPVSRFVYHPAVSTYLSNDGERQLTTTRPLTGSGRPSHSRRPEPGHVKRPRNAYIMFRCDLAKRGLPPESKDVKLQSDFSKVAAKLWKALPQSEKDRYKERWQKEKEEHERLHPGYRYAPKTKKPPSSTGPSLKGVKRSAKGLRSASTGVDPPTDTAVAADTSFVGALPGRRASSAPPFVVPEPVDPLTKLDFDFGAALGSDSTPPSFDFEQLGAGVFDPTNPFDISAATSSTGTTASTDASSSPAGLIPAPSVEPSTAQYATTTAAFQGDLMLVSPFSFDRRPSFSNLFASHEGNPVGQLGGSFRRRESRAAILKSDALPEEVLQALAGAARSLLAPLPNPDGSATSSSPDGLGAWPSARRDSVSVAGHGELGIVDFPKAFLEGIPEEQTFDWYGNTFGTPQQPRFVSLQQLQGSSPAPPSQIAPQPFHPDLATRPGGEDNCLGGPEPDPAYRFPALPLPSSDQHLPDASSSSWSGDVPMKYVLLDSKLAKDERFIDYLLGEGYGVTFRAEDGPASC